MKYENTFKAIDQILWKEQGCGSELDMSSLLFMVVTRNIVANDYYRCFSLTR